MLLLLLQLLLIMVTTTVFNSMLIILYYHLILIQFHEVDIIIPRLTYEDAKFLHFNQVVQNYYRLS